MFLLSVKLNIIEIVIPPILDKTNADDVMKNKLKKIKSIKVAIPPVMQNKINLEKLFIFNFIRFLGSKFL